MSRSTEVNFYAWTAFLRSGDAMLLVAVTKVLVETPLDAKKPRPKPNPRVYPGSPTPPVAEKRGGYGS